MRLDRYLFSEQLRPTLLSLCFYTFVLLMNQLFDFVREAFQRGTPVLVVFQLLGLALPKILVLTIPMATLLGVLVGMGRLSADSEVVALRAAGVSYYRMARPILVLGILAFAVGAGLYNFAAPWTYGRIEDLRNEIVRRADPNREIRPRVFYEEIPGALIYAEDVVSQDAVWPLRRVFLYLEQGTEGQHVFVCGARGRIEHAPGEAGISIVVQRGEIHTNDPSHPEAYNTIPFKGPFRQVFFAEGDPQAHGRRKTIQEQSLAELRAERRRLEGFADWRSNPGRSLRHTLAGLEIAWRFSVPFAGLAFALMAFPLGIISHRGGKSSGFAISLVVIMVFWVLFIGGRDLARDGKIPVWVGAWGASFLILLGALVLLALRQRLEVLSAPRTLSAAAAFFRTLLSRKSSRKRVPSDPRNGLRTEAAHSHESRISILDRHLSRRFLIVFAYVLLSVFLLYAVVEVRGLLDSLLERHLPMSLAFSYLFYFAPGMLKVLLPIASVMAGLVTLGSMCRANEDTALKAAGISVYRIAAPLLLVTVLLSGAYFVVQNYVAPLTNQRASKILDLIEGRTSSTGETGSRWAFGKDERVYRYADYDSAHQTLQDVTAIDLAPDSFTVKKRLWAPRVTWTGGQWVAAQGWQRSFKDGREASYERLDGSPVRWSETPEDFSRQERSVLGSGRLAEEMSFLDLKQHIQRMRNRGYDTTQLRVALYEKLAFPVSPIVMLLIGLPFSFQAGRRGSLYGLGIALALVIIYWSSFAVASALGQQGILPPLLAAFSPNLLFALAGSYFFLSIRS